MVGKPKQFDSRGTTMKQHVKFPTNPRVDMKNLICSALVLAISTSFSLLPPLPRSQKKYPMNPSRIFTASDPLLFLNDDSTTTLQPRRRKKISNNSTTTLADSDIISNNQPSMTKGRRMKQNKPPSLEAMHWRTQSNTVILGDEEIKTTSAIIDHGVAEEFFSNNMSNDIESKNRLRLVHFQVGGKPLPLRRHRSSRGFIYNPSAQAQISFRNVVQELLFPEYVNDNSAFASFTSETFVDNHESVIVSNVMNSSSSSSSSPSPMELSSPLFGCNESLVMTLAFHMRRPNEHFISGRRGPGRLKQSSPPRLIPTPRPPDVDNLAKFVLDSLTGLLYADDRQVVSLHVTKLLDNHGSCLGYTDVCIQRIREDDHHQLDRLLTNSFHLLDESSSKL